MKHLRVDITIFLFSYLIFLFFIRPAQINGGWFNLLDLSISIVDNHSFVLQRPDLYGYCEVSFYKGGFYCGHSHGSIIFLVPLYFISKPFISLLPYLNKLMYLNLLSIIFISIPCSSLCLVILNRILSFYPINSGQRLKTILFAGFGTYFFSFATGESRIPFSFLLIFLIIYLTIVT
ncbi:MAG: hypothetical protein AB1765_01575 [Candidatus Hydrogenedentota bacterium]